MAPSFARTPESFFAGLKRNDSKNPLTTCYGVTSTGRPCRRSLGAAVNALNAAGTTDEESSVIMVREEDDEHGSEITAFFCWQHKDQADSYHVGRTKVVQLKNRSSLEDMMSNMGLHDIQEIKVTPLKPVKPTQRQNSRYKSTQHDKLVPTTSSHPSGERQHEDRAQYTQSHSNEKRTNAHIERAQGTRTRPQRKLTLWDIICGCHNNTANDLRYEEPVRPRRRQPKPTDCVDVANMPAIRTSDVRRDSQLAGHTDFKSPYYEPKTIANRTTSEPKLAENTQSTSHKQQTSTDAHLILNGPKPTQSNTSVPDRPTTYTKRWASEGDGPTFKSHTLADELTSVIPRDASRSLRSSLLAEMSKVGNDQREGYIYIYRLDEENRVYSSYGSESLLTASTQSDKGEKSEAAVQKVLLKIGRTDNVHKRLRQWQSQCGHQPLLVWSYPRVSSGKKVKHLHIVERLIHIELRAMKLRKECSACGRQHREWFEVAGSSGIKDVNRVIEKWIAWSDRQVTD